MATLYIISTPIGNIEDISKRSINILEQIDIILCEDTRVTAKLLRLLNIDTNGKKLLPYFEHNERSKYKKAIELLVSGNDLVLVSDAGSPLLSDPGFLLVREIRKLGNKDIDIDVLPGSSSISLALVTSGLPSDKFTFLGFVPKKPSDRKKLFKNVKKSFQHLKSTYIVFETMVRLESTLDAMKVLLGKDLKVTLCIELTKKHQRIYTGTVLDHLVSIRSKKLKLKGELVIVFSLR